MGVAIELPYEWLGCLAYEPVWQRLQERAHSVATAGAKEIILSCEHEPVYTTGRRGVDNRLVDVLPAAVTQTDRGGEMTFHGTGQVMLYPVIHLRARHLGVKAYVSLLEQSCIDVLQSMGVAADRRCGFPGVWTLKGKIAALGVRVKHGVAYHGMALNVDVDPVWFAAINPCGLQSCELQSCEPPSCEPPSCEPPSCGSESRDSHSGEPHPSVVSMSAFGETLPLADVGQCWQQKFNALLLGLSV